MSSLTKTPHPKKGIQNPLTAICLFLLLFFYAAFNSHAQLSPGDIAFTGVNSVDPDQFSFIVTTNIPGGEIIYFTDRGYADEIPGWLNTSEGILKYTCPAEGLFNGDMIVIADSEGWQILQGSGTIESITGTGNFSLSASGGDQIFAFQTMETENYTPSFIAGIHMNKTDNTNDANWDNIDVSGTTNESDLPNTLTNGLNAIWIHDNYKKVNGKYNNSLTAGGQNDILNSVNNLNNWDVHNSNTFTLGYPTTTATTASGNWSEAATWDNGIPGKITDVSIGHAVTATGTCQANNAVVSAGASLSINNGVEFTYSSLILESDAGQSASLLNEGTFNGEISYKRFLNGGRWYLVSPPVSGQSISGFLAGAGNNIPQNGENRGMMDYNTADDTWNGYFTDATSGNLETGKGYALRRETQGTVTFTGSLVNSPVNVPVSDAGNRWNLIGNPYPSALNATSAADANHNFLLENSDNLDPSYTALYLWDEAAGFANGEYVILNNIGSESIGQDHLQAAQGFFVKAAPGATSIGFTPEMRVSRGDAPFKSGGTSWPEIKVLAETENQVVSTTLLFHKSMHKGLDVGYDAGAFASPAEPLIATRLAEDNGVDFAIQCLPDNFSEKQEIPLTIKLKEPGTVTFSAQLTACPDDVELFIGDIKDGSIHNLSHKNNLYTTTVSGIETNRFTLFTGRNLTKSEIEYSSNINVVIAPAEEQIIVTGIQYPNATICIYDIFGKKAVAYRIASQGSSKINFTGQANGIYFIQVKDKYEVISKKIAWIK